MAAGSFYEKTFPKYFKKKNFFTTDCYKLGHDFYTSDLTAQFKNIILCKLITSRHEQAN